MSSLREAILTALALKERAREALDEISAYPECDALLRRRTYDFDRDLDQNKVFTDQAHYELERILHQVDLWIREGREKVLIWDEGCPHSGWVETVLPDDLAILDHKCRALRELQQALITIADIVAADLIEDHLLR